jgi:hypothetical protein
LRFNSRCARPFAIAPAVRRIQLGRKNKNGPTGVGPLNGQAGKA